MSRHAILLANTARTSDPRTSVTLAHARKNLSEISATLASLGEWRFDPHPIIGQTFPNARTALDKAARAAVKDMESDRDCVLFYYFGHGVERGNDLFFIFADSETTKPPTMMSFRHVTDTLFGHGVRRAIFVLDCCYAGAAGYKVWSAIAPQNKFSIVASAVPTQRAHVMEGESPFGAFSAVFFPGLRDAGATSPPTRDVTVSSLFEYAADLLKEDGFAQQPQIVDGGLNKFKLSEAAPNRFIDPKYNSGAPRKSFYSKLSWIANQVKETPSATVAALYSVVKKRRPPEFLTPIKQPDGSTNYVPVQEGTFRIYLERMLTLGIISDSSDPRLTQKGRSLVASDSRKFNTVLLALVDEQLKEGNSSLDGIDRLVEYKLKTKGIPTAPLIFLDARRREKLEMTGDWFAILLDLAAQSGVFRSAARKTFFPH